MGYTTIGSELIDGILILRHARAELIEVCHQEFQLVRERAISGETEEVQAYYRGQLPEQ